MFTIHIAGKLGQTPQTQKFDSGNTVTKFTVATKNRGVTVWVTVEAWNGLGEIVQEYLSKGAHVAIQARPKVTITESSDGHKTGRPRAWLKDGEAQTQFEFVAESIDF